MKTITKLKDKKWTISEERRINAMTDIQDKTFKKVREGKLPHNFTGTQIMEELNVSKAKKRHFG